MNLSTTSRRPRLPAAALFAGIVLAPFAAARAAEAPPPKPELPETPTAPAYSAKVGPMILSNPVEALTAMADKLDQYAGSVAMEVDGQPISEGQVADMIRAMPVSMASLGFAALHQRALDQLFRQKILAAAGEKQGLAKDPTVRRRMDEAAERALAEAWLTRAAETAVTAPMVRARYDRDIAGKPGPEEVRARVILTATEQEAKDLIGKVQAGMDFADLAHTFSKDASSAAGGDLGYVRVEALGPEVGAAIFALSPGQFTLFPIRTQAGFFIVRVEGRRQRATPTFEEANGELVRQLRREAVVDAIKARAAEVKIATYAPGEKPMPGTAKK